MQRSKLIYDLKWSLLGECYCYDYGDSPFLLFREHDEVPHYSKLFFLWLYLKYVRSKFTLYPFHTAAYLARGNLVLRHSIPLFPPKAGGNAY